MRRLCLLERDVPTKQPRCSYVNMIRGATPTMYQCCCQPKQKRSGRGLPSSWGPPCGKASGLHASIPPSKNNQQPVGKQSAPCYALPQASVRADDERPLQLHERLAPTPQANGKAGPRLVGSSQTWAVQESKTGPLRNPQATSNAAHVETVRGFSAD